MDYLTVKETGEKWGISSRMVTFYCVDGIIKGAVKKGNLWLVPQNAKKPPDGRSLPSILAIAFYILTPLFFALALKKIDISIAYTIGAALGTASVAIIGYILFREQMTLMKITAITMIVMGIIMLNISGVTR